MSYLVLARKYRPQTFADVIGQEHITQTLSNAIAANRLSHAILLSGPRGTGKTTMARLLAKAMNCEQGPTATPCNQCENCKAITAGYSADVLEIDGASNNGVDQVRELRENSKYMPSQSRYKIYIIDEVHMLSLAAFNALLKTLEEPPAHVLFFFATTERHKLPVTILSRCQRYDFRRVQPASVAAHLATLCRNENIEIDPACLDMIALESGGSVRDSISLLDQVISTAKGPVDMAHAVMALGITERQNIMDLARAVISRDVVKALELIAAVYDSGYDLKKLHQDLMEFFRDLLLVKLGQGADLVAGDLKVLQELAQMVDAGALNYCLDVLFRAEGSMKYAANSRLALETMLLRLMAQPPALSIDTLIDKLDDLCRTGISIAGNMEKKTPLIESGSGVVCQPGPSVANNRPDETYSPSQNAPQQTGYAPTGPVAEKFTGNDNDCLPAVIRYLEQNNFGFTAAVLKEAALNSVEGNLVSLKVKGRMAVNRLKSDKYTDAMQQAFKAVLGRDVRFEYECITTQDTENKENLEDRRAKEQALVGHPLINDALEIFRGDVIGIDSVKSAK